MRFIERLSADATCLRGALRTLRMTTPIARHPTRVFPDVIAELAAKHADAPALLSDVERFSYRELAARANRYARWALAQGIRKGDTICLLMPNRPEFMAIWLGVTRIGGVVALLNTHLTGGPLAHCINSVKPRHIVVAAELLDALVS
jgi:fatty-acyl-CoA synthase